MDTIRVVVKTINNETYNLDVPLETPINGLKTLIKDSTSVQEDRQRLIYRGRVMVDEHALRDYQIEDGHTVHMVARPVNYRELQQEQPQQSQTQSTATPTLNTAAETLINTLNNTTTTTGLQGRTHNGTNVTAIPSQLLHNENDLEHIRQGLLTVNTLLSTMDIPALTSNHHPQLSSGVGSTSEMEVCNPLAGGSRGMDTGVSDDYMSEDQEESGVSGDGSDNFSRQFYIGQWVDVKDTVSQWLEATIMNIDLEEKKIFVHYNGWPERWDEWILFDSPRVAPFRSRTSHNSMSTSVSPQPNITVTRSPITGPNDLRALLPEMARIYRQIQPLLEEAALLSENSIARRPIPVDNTPLIPPTTMSNNPRHSRPGQMLTRRSFILNNTNNNNQASNSGGAQVRPLATGMPWSDLVSPANRETPLNERVSINPVERDNYRRQRPRQQLHDNSRRERGGLMFPGRENPFSAGPAVSTSAMEEMTSEGLTLATSSSSTSSNCNYNYNNNSNNRESSSRKRPAAERGFSPLDGGAAQKAIDDQTQHDDDEGAKLSADYAAEDPVEAAAREEARLRHLARELCPLADRFGRTMTDLAAHLWSLSEDRAGSEAESSGEEGVTTGGDNRNNNTGLGRFVSGLGGAGEGTPQFSFESTLLSLLRDRPPSPPPERAYRAPMQVQSRGIAVNGGGRGGRIGGVGALLHELTGLSGNAAMASLLRGATTNNTNNTTAPSGGPSNAPHPGLSGLLRSGGATVVREGGGNYGGGNNQRSNVGHHFDIHIAILSPGTATTNRPTPTMNTAVGTSMPIHRSPTTQQLPTQISNRQNPPPTNTTQNLANPRVSTRGSAHPQTSESELEGEEESSGLGDGSGEELLDDLVPAESLTDQGDSLLTSQWLGLTESAGTVGSAGSSQLSSAGLLSIGSHNRRSSAGNSGTANRESNSEQLSDPPASTNTGSNNTNGDSNAPTSVYERLRRSLSFLP